MVTRQRAAAVGGVGSVVGAGQAGFAQVGYATASFSVGDNLFANPLDGANGPGDNTLDSITAGNGNTVPDGTTIQPWDQTSGQYMPVSTFNAGTQHWSINYTLLIGQGAKLHTMSAFDNLFWGACSLHNMMVLGT